MKLAVICAEFAYPNRLDRMIKGAERVVRNGGIQTLLSFRMGESHVNDSRLTTIIGDDWSGWPAAIEVCR